MSRRLGYSKVNAKQLVLNYFSKESRFPLSDNQWDLCLEERWITQNETKSALGRFSADLTPF